MNHLLKERVKAKNADPFGAPFPVYAALGDSVTEGCFEIVQTGERSLDTVREPENSYPALFVRKAARFFPRAPIQLFNAGISGDSAPNGAARLSRDILPFHPDLVTVSYGLNDCMAGEAGVGAYADALRTIFRSLRENGIDTVFLTPNLMCSAVSYDLPEGFLREVAAGVADAAKRGVQELYYRAALAVCAEENVPVADVYAAWKNARDAGADTDLLLANRINHPSRETTGIAADLLFHEIFSF